MKDSKNLIDLRKMSSEDAANFIIDLYPINSEDFYLAFDLIKARTWSKADQIKLAKYYFQKAPFSNSKVYEIFASIMRIKDLINVTDEIIALEKINTELLFYHLTPVLNKNIKASDDRDAIDIFLKKHSS